MRESSIKALTKSLLDEMERQEDFASGDPERIAKWDALTVKGHDAFGKEVTEMIYVRKRVTDQEKRRELVRAATEMGRALGLRQGAKVFRAMAEESMRVVGTNDIKEAATAIEGMADEIDAKAKADIDAVKV